jgi:hypothetical protein
MKPMSAFDGYSAPDRWAPSNASPNAITKDDTGMNNPTPSYGVSTSTF